eukprot:8272697-Alexandrium_andersonii.AAC.1
MLPSGASGTDLRMLLGPRVSWFEHLKAMLRFPQGGLRIKAGCSTGRPWADCGLHCGHLAM